MNHSQLSAATGLLATTRVIVLLITRPPGINGQLKLSGVAASVEKTPHAG